MCYMDVLIVHYIQVEAPHSLSSPPLFQTDLVVDGDAAAQPSSTSPSTAAVALPLSSPSTSSSLAQPPLTSSANSGYRGEIIVALKFVPPPKVRSSTVDSTATAGSHSSNRRARGMLMVLVKEAKNLVPVARGAANADPFCKWYA